MKIKCPFFDQPEPIASFKDMIKYADTLKCEKYCRNEKELFNHIVNFPHTQIAKKLANQTFKIHEKIEELKNGVRYLDAHALMEIQSLLENE